jgi:tetratricopeptide (TPR) repeat protein
MGGPEAEDKLGLAKAAVAARPDDFRGYALLASALRAGRGDVAAERAALEKAAQLAPANASTLNALAWHDAANGRAAEALPLARRAVQLLPGNPAHLDTFAVALAQAGQCDDALKVEQRAIEILPDGAPAEAAATLRGRLDELPLLCKPPASQAASAQQDAPVTPPQRTNKCKSTGPLAPRTAKLKPGAAVDVEYVINASGGAEQVKGRPGSDPALVRAVSDYLKGCRFIPAKQGGASVPAAMVAHFTFDRVR